MPARYIGRASGGVGAIPHDRASAHCVWMHGDYWIEPFLTTGQSTAKSAVPPARSLQKRMAMPFGSNRAKPQAGSRAAASKCQRRAPGLCCVDGLLRQCVDVTRPDLLRRRVDGQNSVLDVLAMITILTAEKISVRRVVDAARQGPTLTPDVLEASSPASQARHQLRACPHRVLLLRAHPGTPGLPPLPSRAGSRGPRPSSRHRTPVSPPPPPPPAAAPPRQLFTLKDA